jgi:hypothetical protein
MKKQIVEVTEDAIHSISLDIDSKGGPKPSVKTYFFNWEDRDKVAQEVVNLVKQIIADYGMS